MCLQDFRQYIMNNDGKFILDEGERLLFLQATTMRKLVNLMLNYMKIKFGLNASDVQIKQLCLACVNIIPCIKTPNSSIGGIVCTVIFASRQYLIFIFF